MYAGTLAWALIFRSSKIEDDRELSFKTLGIHKRCSQNLFFFFFRNISKLVLVIPNQSYYTVACRTHNSRDWTACWAWLGFRICKILIDWKQYISHNTNFAQYKHVYAGLYSHIFINITSYMHVIFHDSRKKRRKK